MNGTKAICVAVAWVAVGYGAARCAAAEDYSDFARLSEADKARLVWQLHESNTWGTPDQKPICRYLLETQAPNDPNRTRWVVDAIDLAEREGWHDLDDPIRKVYERPVNIWIYERSFRYLRARAMQPVPPDLVSASNTLRSAGHYRSRVTDEELASAQKRLLDDPDKEAAMVSAIHAGAAPLGKGGTERGRKAAADVLRALDKEAVKSRLQQLFDEADYHEEEVEQLAKAADIELKVRTEPADSGAGAHR